jgi:voltage-gated potassium channel Kch
MLMDIVIGCMLVVLTTVVHAAAMVAALQGFRIAHAKRWARASHVTRVTVVASLVLVMFLATLVEAGMWAATYLTLGAISGVERALYFSTVTYTTLGYGDVVMQEGQRLLSSFEAANGIIMFGWTTALIVAVVQRVYLTPPAAGERGA